MRVLLSILSVLGVMTILVSGCANVQPASEIETDPQPIRKGGGIFTGRSGDWTVIRK